MSSSFDYRPSFFKRGFMGSEVQTVENSGAASFDGVPFEPIYFMMGFIAGLIFISLFKGRWFL